MSPDHQLGPLLPLGHELDSITVNLYQMLCFQLGDDPPGIILFAPCEKTRETHVPLFPPDPDQFEDLVEGLLKKLLMNHLPSPFD